jgi:hypothetical protein
MFSNRFSSKAAVFAVSALSFGLSSHAAIAFTFNLQTAQSVQKYLEQT